MLGMTGNDLTHFDAMRHKAGLAQLRLSRYRGQSPSIVPARWTMASKAAIARQMDTEAHLQRATQEFKTPNSRPVAERKPVFNLDSLTRAPAAGDGFGGLVRAAQSDDERQRELVRWWHNRGAGVAQICRITTLSSPVVQAHLTTLSRELGPLEPETRDALSVRLQTQLDQQRCQLQDLAENAEKPNDRIAAHRALLLLARTHADIAGLHRTQDTELARSIESLLSHDGASRVAVAIEYAHADDRRHANEGARLERSERAAIAKHYRPPDATIDSTDDVDA